MALGRYRVCSSGFASILPYPAKPRVPSRVDLVSLGTQADLAAAMALYVAVDMAGEHWEQRRVASSSGRYTALQAVPMSA
jgi:hypothetical protein